MSFQQPEVVAIVAFFEKYLLVPVPSLYYMMRVSYRNYSRYSWHAYDYNSIIIKM